LSGGVPWITGLLSRMPLLWRDGARGSSFSWQRFALVWSAFVFAFFSFSSSKLATYIMPMLPPLALLGGTILARLDARAMRRLLLPSTKWTDGCLVGRCLAAIRTSGAELVLLVALSGSGTSFGYVVTLIRTDTGHVIDQESDRCDVCRVNEVIRGATLAAVDLLNKAPDQLPDEAAEQAAKVDRAITPLQGEIAERDHHANRIGIALVAIGLVGAITGGALYLVDDSRPSYALATATGGLAMATGGVVVLTF